MIRHVSFLPFKGRKKVGLGFFKLVITQPHTLHSHVALISAGCRPWPLLEGKSIINSPIIVLTQ